MRSRAGRCRFRTGGARQGPRERRPLRRRASDVGVDASRLLEVLSRIDCHVYIGETLRGGGYREMFTGPGIEALLGGPIPTGVDPADAWDAAVHPDDYERQANVESGHSGGGPVSVEYRVVGYDGVIRWVLDRMWPWPASPDGRTHL